MRCRECKTIYKNGTEYCDKDRSYLVPSLIDNKYQLESSVGSGGFGDVYKATHIHMSQTVAIKLLNLSNDIAKKRFIKEGQILAKIHEKKSTENIVIVKDLGQSEDISYLVMELLEGETLSTRIIPGKVLSFQEIYKIVMQICSAIQTVHNFGVIHRDIKPSNIFLAKNKYTGEEIVKVLDFGIAKIKNYKDLTLDTSYLTKQGLTKNEIIGTLAYMSPEQCYTDNFDFRSDIYSLGVVIYQIITNYLPVQIPAQIQLLPACNLIVTKPPTPLSSYRADVPEEVEEVILKALEKNPKNRQKNTFDLALGFHNALVKNGLIKNNNSASLTDPTTTLVRDWNVPIPQTFDEPIPVPLPRPYDIINHDDIISPSPPDPLPLPSPDPPPIPPPIPPNPPPPRPVILSPTKLELPVPPPIPEPELSLLRLLQQYLPLAISIVGGLLLFGFLIVDYIYNPAPPEIPKSSPLPPSGMILIPKGTFVMGDDTSSNDAEKPAYQIKIEKDFYIDEYEVTNKQYAEFIKKTQYPAPPNWTNGQPPEGQENYPVTEVNWFDAKAYASWTKKRLPTEEEWEYAARGNTMFIYPWGNEFNINKLNSKEGKKKNSVLPVGTYSDGASPFGVKDLAGNVAEWTDSNFSIYPNSKAKAEPGKKVIRGGSYKDSKLQTTTTTRFVEFPATKLSTVGFRCVKDISNN